EALQRKLRNMKVDFEENVDMLVKHFGYTSRPDLYYALATEEFQLNALKTFDIEGRHFVVKKEKPATESQPARGKARKSKANGKSNILVNGEPAEQYSFMLAGCCKPVQGDDIFAYLSANAGLKIHRTSCPNATHLMANYGYRIMKAEWVRGESSEFVVDLLLTGIDDGVGVIERVTNTISSNLGINIRSFNIAGDEGYFEGRISLVVLNKDQMNLAIRSLKSLKGISQVSRIE
ncbi:MAG: ACT domain-containing protein, partial [Saprospiraceae bacterium]|nr:ACT domain-containing protein [Saprospiraceae bacterium]